MRLAALVCSLLLSLQALALPPHPRLFLTKGEEENLMKNIRADERWQKVHDVILAESDTIVDLPNPTFKLNARKEMHQIGCETVRRMLFLCYSWRMTGEARYLEKAESLAQDICNLRDWNPYHFLDVAEITIAATIAYDWLYDSLSPELRTALKESILNKALITSETGGAGNPDYNLRWMDMTSNWSQICHGSLAIASIAIYEDATEVCDRIISRSRVKMHIPMEAEYVPDGAYSQGIGYWGYGTMLNVMYLDAMEMNFGAESVGALESIPGFMQTGKYFSELLTNTQQSFSFSDNSTGDNLPEHCIFWFYKKTGDPTLLYHQGPMLDRWTTDPSFVHGSYARHDPLMLIWGAGTGEKPCSDFASAKTPEELFYIVRGLNPLCTMRSGWTADDIWVGFKAGNPSCAHGHMDVGEFMLEWGGVRWAEDLGSDSYNAFVSLNKGSLFNMKADALRWNDLLRYNNFSHNTITVNGEFQKLETKAEFCDYGAAPDNMYAVADLTDIYAGQLESAKRRVSLEDGNRVVVVDSLETRPFKNASVVWNLTTRADGFSYDKNNGIITLTATSPDGFPKTMRLKISLGDKKASKCGIKVVRRAVNDEFNYPNMEKPAPGCWFIRIKYNIKKGMSQTMRVEILPEN
ncbi:MAG: heparinase II/III family protein [Bacteroidales bacterium]|nr:heparinase II/III family protein [Bacteroidales bacterium]